MRTPRCLALGTVGLALCWGCAAGTQASSPTPAGESDCSFRSATSCWTVSPRFPSGHVRARDTVPADLLDRPPMLVATGTDSAGAREGR
jgi:hypothetical protein